MSQPSWGGGPAGSPPHAQMNSSFPPLMQLLSFDDISLNHLQCLFNLHVPVSFCAYFPACRGHLGVFISHVLPYFFISLDDHSKHCMYVRFIMLLIWLMFRLTHASLLCSVVFRAPYSLYYCLGGHRYASLSLLSWCLMIEFLQRTSVIRFSPNTRMLGGNLLHHFFGHLTHYH